MHRIHYRTHKQSEKAVVPCCCWVVQDVVAVLLRRRGRQRPNRTRLLYAHCSRCCRSPAVQPHTLRDHTRNTAAILHRRVENNDDKHAMLSNITTHNYLIYSQVLCRFLIKFLVHMVCDMVWYMVWYVRMKWTWIQSMLCESLQCNSIWWDDPNSTWPVTKSHNTTKSCMSGSYPNMPFVNYCHFPP